MHIVQVAQLVHDTSGGLRTTIERLGAGYVAAGHQRSLIVPGRMDSDRHTPGGRVITLRAPRIPGAGGYRLFPSLRRVIALLDVLSPDALEISDKVSLWRLGSWARQRGIGTVVISHERLDAILAERVPRGTPLSALADRWNRRVLQSVDIAVAPSEFAADELRRVNGHTPVSVVPWGVDLDRFHPDHRSARHGHLDDFAVRPSLVYVGRLSREKRVNLVIECARELARRGMRVHTDIIGAGPAEAGLERLAQGLDVRFHGFVRERDRLAAMLASADVALAPCPCEAFGLAALEALASGVPVVASASGGLAELITHDIGRIVQATSEAFADGVQQVLELRGSLGADVLRKQARKAAENRPWSQAVEHLLELHGATA